MLSERERRSLTEIELSLRMEDRRLVRSFELFRLDPLLETLDEAPRRPALAAFVRRTRWVLAITAIASIVPLWAAVLMTSGMYAALAQILVLPLSSLLLAMGLALHPDRRRRTGRRGARRRVAQRWARDPDGSADGSGSRAATR